MYCSVRVYIPVPYIERTNENCLMCSTKEYLLGSKPPHSTCTKIRFFVFKIVLDFYRPHVTPVSAILTS